MRMAPNYAVLCNETAVPAVARMPAATSLVACPVAARHTVIFRLRDLGVKEEYGVFYVLELNVSENCHY